ncbi:hypothetical protein WJX81_005123 [Elliptochloris bilobata]|uniref:RRM domain-containing protein n=1 Tax=Elliptochloris bilobata TaxID=381761 RepID=A0AAW1QN53_9CHLO
MEEGAQAEQESTSEDRAAPPAEHSGRRLFLGGLPWDVKKEDLLTHFGQYGEVEEAVVITERGTDRPRGFGFVTFKHEEDALRVCRLEHILGREHPRKVDVKKSVPQEHKPRSKKVFVGGLATSTTPEMLQEYFGQFGTVTDAQIMLDHQTKRSRGFGFITFADEAGAQQYHVGPGYGMPAYGQASFPGYSGLMVPHMGGLPPGEGTHG